MPNELANLRRRVNRARDFPANTCPASRELHQIAEGLLRGFPIMADQQMQAAESMLAVLESLWKARTELKRRGK